MSDLTVKGFGATTNAAYQNAQRRASKFMAGDPRGWVQTAEEYEIEFFTTRKDEPLVCRLGFSRVHTLGDA